MEVVRHQQLRAASRTGRPSIAEQGAWAETEILQIFAEVFVHDVLSDDETARKRVLSITRQIQVREATCASKHT